MTPIERRDAFLTGILMNAYHALEHAVKLVDGESADLLGYDDKDGRRMIAEAYVSLEKAKDYFMHKIDTETNWKESKKNAGAK